MKTIYVYESRKNALIPQIRQWIKTDITLECFTNQRLTIRDILIIAESDIQMVAELQCNILIYEELLKELTNGAYDDLKKNYDYYFLKNALEKARKPEIHTLICGSSYMRFGIEEGILEETVNCSLPSQDLYYALQILKYVLEGNRNIKNVVLGGGYYYLFSDLSKTQNEKEIQRVANVYWPIFKDAHNCIFVPARNKDRKYSPIFDVDKIYNESIEQYFAENPYFSGHKKRTRAATKLWNDTSKVWQDLSFEEKTRAGEERAQIHNKGIRRIATLEENIHTIREFVNICKENGINVVFLIAPTTEYYQKHIDTKYKEVLYGVLDEIEYPINLIDLVDSEEFLDEDFNDMDHLGDIGAKKMTYMLKAFLKEFSGMSN